LDRKKQSSNNYEPDRSDGGEYKKHCFESKQVAAGDGNRSIDVGSPYKSKDSAHAYNKMPLTICSQRITTMIMMMNRTPATAGRKDVTIAGAKPERVARDRRNGTLCAKSGAVVNASPAAAVTTKK
jgi:hypothetical protein